MGKIVDAMDWINRNFAGQTYTGEGENGVIPDLIVFGTCWAIREREISALANAKRAGYHNG
jgi:hypothetical protein